MTFPAIPAPAWSPTNREYHATMERWSSSMIADFRESPALAHGRYVTRTIEREPPTPSMICGSLVNLLLLEPGRAKVQIAVADVESRNSKAFRQLAETAPFAVTRPEMERATAIVDAFKNPRTKAAEVAAALLMGPGISEYAHKWEEPGVPCKCMVDKLALFPSGEPVQVELKTTTDPREEPFSATVDRYDYDAQAAFNLRGIQHALGGFLPRFYWIAVRNEPPHEVFVWQLGEEFYALGEQKISRDLAALAARLRGDVPWCSSLEEMRSGSIPVLEPPRWALRKLYSAAAPAVTDAF